MTSRTDQIKKLFSRKKPASALKPAVDLQQTLPKKKNVSSKGFLKEEFKD